MAKRAMNCLLFRLVLLLVGSNLVAADISIQPQSISGVIQLPPQWNRMAYLCYIPNLNERFTISNSMIIDEAKINVTGYFHFNTEFLPKEKGLYRIHVTKRGYPRASLTIGGKAQNFQFLIADKYVSLYLENSDTTQPFQSLFCKDDRSNKNIYWVNEWVQFADSAHFAGSTLKKELVVNAISDKLRLFADSCSDPIAALYALYNSDFERNAIINEAYYDRFLNKWDNENSDYFRTFAANFNKSTSSKSNLNWLWIVVISFLGGASISWFILRRKPEKKLEEALSIQERKVYLLLKQGKSNKEISEEYNIGINTVKSHVSSIYAKLKVKSRKELLD
jgi:DNA-binding CsgD family transcriptional regulator